MMVQGCESFSPFEAASGSFLWSTVSQWKLGCGSKVSGPALEVRLVKLGVSAMCICWGFKSIIRHAVCRCWIHNPVGKNCAKQWVRKTRIDGLSQEFQVEVLYYFHSRFFHSFLWQFLVSTVISLKTQQMPLLSSAVCIFPEPFLWIFLPLSHCLSLKRKEKKKKSTLAAYVLSCRFHYQLQNHK